MDYVIVYIVFFLCATRIAATPNGCLPKLDKPEIPKLAQFNVDEDVQSRVLRLILSNPYGNIELVRSQEDASYISTEWRRHSSVRSNVKFSWGKEDQAFLRIDTTFNVSQYEDDVLYKEGEMELNAVSGTTVEPSAGSDLGLFVGMSVAACVLFSIVVVLVICLIRRRRSSSAGRRNEVRMRSAGTGSRQSARSSAGGVRTSRRSRDKNRRSGPVSARSSFTKLNYANFASGLPPVNEPAYETGPLRRQAHVGTYQKVRAQEIYVTPNMTGEVDGDYAPAPTPTYQNAPAKNMYSAPSAAPTGREYSPLAMGGEYKPLQLTLLALIVCVCGVGIGVAQLSELGVCEGDVIVTIGAQLRLCDVVATGRDGVIDLSQFVTDAECDSSMPTATPAPATPSSSPTMRPSAHPTVPPGAPTPSPTPPTNVPTKMPTPSPSKQPTAKPTKQPTAKPTKMPTPTPTKAPTNKPTKQPTPMPTLPTYQNPVTFCTPGQGGCVPLSGEARRDPFVQKIGVLYILTFSVGSSTGLEIWESTNLVQWTRRVANAFPVVGVATGQTSSFALSGEGGDTYGKYYCNVREISITYDVASGLYVMLFTANRGFGSACDQPSTYHEEYVAPGVYLCTAGTLNGPYCQAPHQPQRAGAASTCGLLDEIAMAPRNENEFTGVCRAGTKTLTRCYRTIRGGGFIFKDGADYWLAYSFHTDPQIVGGEWGLAQHRGRHIGIWKLLDVFQLPCLGQFSGAESTWAVSSTELTRNPDRAEVHAFCDGVCANYGNTCLASQCKNRFTVSQAASGVNMVSGVEFPTISRPSVFKRRASPSNVWWYYMLFSVSTPDSKYLGVAYRMATSVLGLSSGKYGVFIIPGGTSTGYGQGSVILGPDNTHFYYVYHRTSDSKMFVSEMQFFQRSNADCSGCANLGDVWIRPIRPFADDTGVIIYP